MSRTQLLALGRMLSQIHPIPIEIEGRILPQQAQSVTQLLDFHLPPTASTAESDFPASEFFAAQALLDHTGVAVADNATIIGLLPSLPIPSASQLVEIAKHCTKEQDRQSLLLCPHSRDSVSKGQHLPLWVVTYWIKVHDIIQTHQQPWFEAKQHLKCLGRRSTPSNKCASGLLLADVNDVLQSLPWAGSVDTLDGRDPVHELTAYASRKWFSDVHENQMLYSLRMAIQSDDLRKHIPNVTLMSTPHLVLSNVYAVSGSPLPKAKSPHLQQSST